MLTPKQIRDLRLAMGLKAPEFAELMGGMSEATVWRWERGERHPTYRRMVKLSQLWDEAVAKGLFKAAVSA